MSTIPRSHGDGASTFPVNQPEPQPSPPETGWTRHIPLTMVLTAVVVVGAGLAVNKVQFGHLGSEQAAMEQRLLSAISEVKADLAALKDRTGIGDRERAEIRSDLRALTTRVEALERAKETQDIWNSELKVLKDRQERQR